jgi:AcrR family transcriptional regulator
MSQAERSAATKAALLDATIDCIVTYGYADASAERICEAAGVTRGALVHHFASKDGMVTAAIDHLAERIVADFHGQAEQLPPDGDRAVSAVDLIWLVFNRDPLFPATLDLWVVARTDDALRERLQPLRRTLDRASRTLLADVFGPLAGDIPDFDKKASVLLSTVRGVSLLRLLGADRAAVERQWAYAREFLLPLFQPAA